MTNSTPRHHFLVCFYFKTNKQKSTDRSPHVATKNEIASVGLPFSVSLNFVSEFLMIEQTLQSRSWQMMFSKQVTGSRESNDESFHYTYHIDVVHPTTVGLNKKWLNTIVRIFDWNSRLNVADVKPTHIDCHKYKLKWYRHKNDGQVFVSLGKKFFDDTAQSSSKKQGIYMLNMRHDLIVPCKMIIYAFTDFFYVVFFLAYFRDLCTNPKYQSDFNWIFFFSWLLCYPNRQKRTPISFLFRLFNYSFFSVYFFLSSIFASFFI